MVWRIVLLTAAIIAVVVLGFRLVLLGTLSGVLPVELPYVIVSALSLAAGIFVVGLGRKKRTPPTLPPEPDSTEKSKPEALTDREWEVAQEVARGLTNKEIASTLHVTENTVKTHLSRCYRKLGVTTRAGLTAVVHGGDPVVTRLGEEPD